MWSAQNLVQECTYSFYHLGVCRYILQCLTVSITWVFAAIYCNAWQFLSPGCLPLYTAVPDSFYHLRVCRYILQCCVSEWLLSVCDARLQSLTCRAVWQPLLQRRHAHLLARPHPQGAAHGGNTEYNAYNIPLPSFLENNDIYMYTVRNMVLALHHNSELLLWNIWTTENAQVKLFRVGFKSVLHL